MAAISAALAGGRDSVSGALSTPTRAPDARCAACSARLHCSGESLPDSAAVTRTALAGWSDVGSEFCGALWAALLREERVELEVALHQHQAARGELVLLAVAVRLADLCPRSLPPGRPLVLRRVHA